MKLPIICSTCMIENIATARPIVVVEPCDNGRYEVICPKGHKSVTVLQQQKFEVLFDIGAYALIDGYYREAVSSFTPSLERFYEFVIMAVLFQRGISEETFNQTWKLVERQSLKQVGAFIFIYLSEFGTPPTVLCRKRVDFRDEVIHQGKIPTRQEAITYGQAILDVVRPILKQIKGKCPDGVQKTVVQHLTECQSGKQEQCQASTLGVSTILSLSVCDPNHDKRTLEESLTGLIRWEQQTA